MKQTPLEQFKENLAMSMFGRSPTLAAAANQCVMCGKTADKFRDELSKREYRISKMCQSCQDKTFGV